MKKNNNWAGYDMEQLRIRQATTELRIEIEKERLAQTFSCNFGSSGDEDAPMLAIADIFTAAEYGVKAYKVVRRILDILKVARS